MSAMTANTELARIFEEMAAILEITGADRFRINAYTRAAQALEDLTVDVADIAEPKKLTAIDGIGASTAKKIIEFLDTGHVTKHDELLENVPRGLLELRQIPGLGPKKVKLLWEEAGVTDLDTLQRKLETDELEALPGMGKKSVENLKESIVFVARAGERARLGEALPLAEAITAELGRVAGVHRVHHAGSLRRGRETIGDIDLLAAATDPAALREAFLGLPGVQKVLVSGGTKCSVRMDPGIQVDLRVVDETSFGAALLYFTGSKAHNVLLRERAIKQGLRLNEYGLFPAGGGDRPVASCEETDVFAALGLPWIPPELREDRGELGLTEAPRLIELADVKAELHAHTVASDGRMTIDELARTAMERGFHTIAVTDHSKSAIQANGLSPERLREHVDQVREANERIDGITILAGSEVDILGDGRLDYDDDLLAELDLVVASPHVALRQEPEAATERLVRAIRHPLVHVLGHPTGRIINRREGLHPQINAIVQAAAETDTALELNANYYRLDLRDVHVKAAVDGGALVAINTDAHHPDDFDLLRYGVLTGRRGWLTPQRCLNAWPAQKLHAWLRSKR